MKLCQLQLPVSADKLENVRALEPWMERAADQGADLFIVHTRSPLPQNSAAGAGTQPPLRRVFKENPLRSTTEGILLLFLYELYPFSTGHAPAENPLTQPPGAASPVRRLVGGI